MDEEVEPWDPDEDLQSYIKRKFLEELDKVLKEGPWWCVICGEGGNYEGERPDAYWFPPEDHVCPPPPSLKRVWRDDWTDPLSREIVVFHSLEE